jgi:hypothetical protein
LQCIIPLLNAVKVANHASHAPESRAIITPMRLPLPPLLESKLADFRRHVWTVKLLEGLLAALAGLYLGWLLHFILDRIIETPGWLRWLLLLGGASWLGIGLPLIWHRWVWRQRRLEDAARVLRRSFPRLGDQLLGIVELARGESAASGRSERLVQAAMEQAAEAVRERDLRGALPLHGVSTRSWVLGSLIVIFASMLFLTREATLNAFARWLMPWEEIPRYTFARVQPLPEQRVVPLGEPMELRVPLEPSARWHPAQAKVTLDGFPTLTSALKAGEYAWRLPPLQTDASLHLRVGDVIECIRIQPRTRPELSSLTLQLTLPDYLQYTTQPRLEIRGGSVRVLKGSQATLEASADRELAAAWLDEKALQTSAASLRGTSTLITASSEHALLWRDVHGLEPKAPLLLHLDAVQDEAPRLSARRESREQVVLDTETITLTLEAQDDFGLHQLGLEWRSAETGKVLGSKISHAGEPEKSSLTAPATFCASRDEVSPQRIELRGWALDYLPGRARCYSAPFTFVILNKTDHALWLTEQFGKWLESARESYEREQQLHATNKELRQLSAEELDRPENRRKLAQQATAEQANAARLSSLNQSGRSLVEQAARNDEFDAARLESWATMLQSLQDIAAKRMPSVAELLKASSTAKTSPASPSLSSSSSPKSASSSAAKDSPPPKQGLPSLTQKDSSLTPSPEGTPKPSEASSKPSALKLPTNQLGAAPAKDGEKEAAKPAESPAQQKADEAIEEQELLLAEFARVSDELAAVLASLEASTFVKRLKKASRQQMTAASDLSTKTLSAFGLEKEPVAEAEGIAEKQKQESETLRLIQSDLEAYYARKPEMHFKNVIAQMKQMQAVRALATLGEQAADNLSGSSLSGAEYWADTLDRWAEEMVAASQCKACSSCSSESLPPEIVLQVMKALQEEMKLRDETREVENAKPAHTREEHQKLSTDLGSRQYGIQARVRGAFDHILRLPSGEAKFQKELKLLAAVMKVMEDAAVLLDQPETGAPAIAAETEAIELLLQTKRPPPNGGGGGGSNPGGGSGQGRGRAALADLGEEAGAETSRLELRPVGQSTGKAGRELPEEFKNGLDAYFNKLEAR